MLSRTLEATVCRVKFVSALLALFLLFAAGASLHAVENLVRNSGFENDELGMLSMWTTEALVHTDEAVRFFATDQARHSGRRSFAIANLQPNDSRAVQWVVVKPDTLYKLSAWVTVHGMVSGGTGANISVLGSTTAAGGLKDTGGKWRLVELYGRTGPAQTALAVLVRLGFYGSPSKGIALFDDVSLEEAAAVPAGMKAVSFGANEAADVFPVVSSGQEAPEPAGRSPGPLTLPWVVTFALAAVAAAASIFNGILLALLARSRRSLAPAAGSPAVLPPPAAPAARRTRKPPQRRLPALPRKPRT
jgi:hypothetical protein